MTVGTVGTYVVPNNVAIDTSVKSPTYLLPFIQISYGGIFTASPQWKARSTFDHFPTPAFLRMFMFEAAQSHHDAVEAEELLINESEDPYL